MTDLQSSCLLLSIFAGLTVITGLVLTGREWLQGRDDVRFHTHAKDPAVKISAQTNQTRAAGLFVLGITDVILCALLIARCITDPITLHLWGAIALVAQGIGYLLVAAGEARARTQIEAMRVDTEPDV